MVPPDAASFVVWGGAFGVAWDVSLFIELPMVPTLKTFVTLSITLPLMMLPMLLYEDADGEPGGVAVTDDLTSSTKTDPVWELLPFNLEKLAGSLTKDRIQRFK